MPETITAVPPDMAAPQHVQKELFPPVSGPPRRLPFAYPRSFVELDEPYPSRVIPQWPDTSTAVAYDSMGGTWELVHVGTALGHFMYLEFGSQPARHYPPLPAPFRFPIGPSRYDCDRRCIGREGCAACNPDEWRQCLTGQCPSGQRFNISRSQWDEDDCPCLVTCLECGGRFSVDYVREVDGDRYCDSCHIELFDECSACEEVYRSDEGHDCPEACDQCGGTCLYGNSDGIIRDYGYKPHPAFHGDGPVYFGMEIELESSRSRSLDEAASLAQHRMGSVAYLKEDGSLSNGFEVVTHPMSYDYALNKFPWDTFRELRQVGMSGDEQAGVHIHINRSAFIDACHVYRWLKLIHRNRNSVVRLAGRRSTWARFERSDREWAIDYAKRGRNALHSSPGPVWYSYPRRKRTTPPAYDTSRYRAVNMNNSETVEVRIFRGSANENILRGYLAFVAASVEYSRSLSAHDILTKNAWQWDVFLAWASERPEYMWLGDLWNKRKDIDPDDDENDENDDGSTGICGCSACTARLTSDSDDDISF